MAEESGCAMKLSRWYQVRVRPVSPGARLNSLDSEAKTMTPCASARSPTDSVPIDGTVRVAQNFINGLKLNLIDFGGGLRSSLGCGRQFSKPSEL
jgi:hypothetical protein